MASGLLYPRAPNHVYAAILTWAYVLPDEGHREDDVLVFYNHLKETPEKVHDFTHKELERLIEILETTKVLLEKEMEVVSDSDEDMLEVLFDDYCVCKGEIAALRELSKQT